MGGTERAEGRWDREGREGGRASARGRRLGAARYRNISPRPDWLHRRSAPMRAQFRMRAPKVPAAATAAERFAGADAYHPSVKLRLPAHLLVALRCARVYLATPCV